MGDVAGFIFEPVQGMTGEPLDAAYLREAENLCEQHGTVLIADEIQTGLGRTGAWFATREMGVRPHIMTVSKTLSGGQIPVGAVLVNENIYDRIYSGFGSGLVYFSTFAENNMAMAAALATLETLEETDAPAEAAWKGDHLMRGLRDMATRYDCIDRVVGKGLMITVYCLSHAPALLMLELPGYEGENAKLLLFLVVVVQLSDVLQYVWGKLLGRHKIAPDVSPNKTVEGFVGGVLSATAIGAGLWWATPFGPWEAAGFAFLICLFGFAGGLVASAIKRDRGVKDFSSLIAGHGGILDRIDSLCFAAPLFFHLVRYFYGRPPG